MSSGIGYAYHYIPKEKWYISAKVIPMFGHEWYKVTFDDVGSAHSNFWTWAVQSDFSLGYNSETFFGGGKASIYYTENLDKEDLSKFKKNIFQIFIGYRFKAPKFLKKTFDFTENLLKKTGF